MENAIWLSAFFVWTLILWLIFDYNTIKRKNKEYLKREQHLYTKRDLMEAWQDGNKHEVDQYGGEGISFTGSETFDEYFNKEYKK